MFRFGKGYRPIATQIYMLIYTRLISFNIEILDAVDVRGMTRLHS